MVGLTAAGLSGGSGPDALDVVGVGEGPRKSWEERLMEVEAVK